MPCPCPRPPDRKTRKNNPNPPKKNKKKQQEKTRRPGKINQENRCRVRAPARPPVHTNASEPWKNLKNKEKQPKPAQEKKKKKQQDKTRRPRKLNQENRCRARAPARPPVPHKRFRTKEKQEKQGKTTQTRPRKKRRSNKKKQEDQGSLTNKIGAAPCFHAPARPRAPNASLKTREKPRNNQGKTKKYKQATRRHVGATLVGQGSPPWPAGPAEAWQIGGKAGVIAAAPRKALAERLGLQQKGCVYNIKAGFIAERLVYRSYAPQRSCRKAGFIAERLGLSQLCPARLLQKGRIYRRKAGFIPERQGLSQLCPARLLRKGWIYRRKAGFIAAMPSKALAERRSWEYRV